MNNKGQTLIIFVIMIPIFLVLAALVVDLGLITNEKIKLSGTTSTILKELYEQRMNPEIKEKIKDLYQKNDIPVSQLEIEITTMELKIKNAYAVDSVFGKVIGIKQYQLSIKKSVHKESENLIITKE